MAHYRVIYRPLYDHEYYEGIDASVRPYEMFIEDVEKADKTFPRFKLISDETVLNKLKRIRDEKYKTN